MKKLVLIGAIALSLIATGAMAQETLRVLTWKGYAPAKLIKAFEAETGIDVKLTYSNNEEMIAKLRATRGAGFDLAQPSQDRISFVQEKFPVYQPIDFSKVNTAQLTTSMVDAVKKPSLNLALSPERRRTVTFAKDVSPIIRQKCATSACHGGGGPPRFGTRDAVRTHVTGTARRSPLVWHLLGRNTSRPWDPPPAAMSVIEQMPPEGAAPLTDIEKRIIMEWIDLGAE